MMKPFLVDDGGLEPLLVWATTSAGAKAIAKKTYGQPKRDQWGCVIGENNWDAEVYGIKLPDVIPPRLPGFEDRPEVLEMAASQIRV